MLAHFRAFFSHEAAGGIVLLAAAVVALIIASSPLDHAYHAVLDTPIAVGVGSWALREPVHFWINDGLMAVFFFLIGLEVKREVLVGDLSSVGRAILPLIAALGGIIVPALIYTAINWHNPIGLKGWAIPAATDIAFAVGVMALLGSRLPQSLKLFLLALAIADDLGAILIIAVFYSHGFSFVALGLAGVCGLMLFGLNRWPNTPLVAFLFLGVVLWLCVLKSGLHATLSGVALAFAIPLRSKGDEPSMLETVEHALEPWVQFGIAPLFAFANAGVSLVGFSLSSLLEPIPLGIAAGLFVGKQVGIFSATWLAVKSKIADMPRDATWLQIYGVSVLGGIGFTMSLFIGTLAFPDPTHAADVRIGVLVGSITSALLGYELLRRAPAFPTRPPHINPA